MANRIKTVISFNNGMVMVFDQNGQQISEFQGKRCDVFERILKAAPNDAVFEHSYNLQSHSKRLSRAEWATLSSKEA